LGQLSGELSQIPGHRFPKNGVWDRRQLLGSFSLLLSSRAAAVNGETAADGPARAWDRAEVYFLWPAAPPGGGFHPRKTPANWPAKFARNIDRPSVRVFRPVVSNGVDVLIIPGGGYEFVSIFREGAEVAQELNLHGFTAWVLTYRLPREGWVSGAEAPFEDLGRALEIVSRAGVGARGNRGVVLLGFSAGGHLAASWTGRQRRGGVKPSDPVSALALVYPVIALSGPNGHHPSAKALLGAENCSACDQRYSPLSFTVTDWPPVFLTHAADDPVVPFQNSHSFADRLARSRVGCEYHLFPHGGHGFGLGKGFHASLWTDLFSVWLSTIGATPAPEAI